MVSLSDEEFESAVQGAIDALPDEFFDELENVAILLADEPEDDDFEGDGYYTDEGDLLGLYDGVALTERGDWYGAGNDYPDTITVFKGPHERLSEDRAVVLEEIRKTVVHEIAHYFGMDEDQVSDMGYA